MRPLFVSLGLGLLTFGAAQASEIDSCTTFSDAPPIITDNMVCDREAQHSREMGLPAAVERTVLSLNDLYELRWSLHSMHRFLNSDGNYVYRVYLVRAE